MVDRDPPTEIGGATVTSKPQTIPVPPETLKAARELLKRDENQFTPVEMRQIMDRGNRRLRRTMAAMFRHGEKIEDVFYKCTGWRVYQRLSYHHWLAIFNRPVEPPRPEAPPLSLPPAL